MCICGVRVITVRAEAASISYWRSNCYDLGISYNTGQVLLGSQAKGSKAEPSAIEDKENITKYKKMAKPKSVGKGGSRKKKERERKPRDILT